MNGLEARGAGKRYRRAMNRVAGPGIPSGQKVSALSGGQQAQLALSIALAKRPRLLIVDEPLARLDPLARHDFMSLLMAAAAEDGLSVIFSSHVVAELGCRLPGPRRTTGGCRSSATLTTCLRAPTTH